MAEIGIIGAGPAGISAALTAHARGKDVFIVSNDPLQSALAKAEKIDNYPGLVGDSGTEMVQSMLDGLNKVDIEVRQGRVVNILPFGEEYLLSIGQDVEQVKTVILATGAAKGIAYKGEEELLGRGVSYCATCDGMLYRERPVCVVGSSEEAQKEANFLNGIGCKVTFVSPKDAPLLDDGILFHKGAKVEIVGKEKVEGLTVDGEQLSAEAVFVLRPAIAPSSLMPGLETEGAFIKVDAEMQTNLKGIFAAGDCVGKPLQVAKAVGQGQMAAFSAVAYLEEKAKQATV